MSQYTVVVTDFGENNLDIESEVINNSGLDINLVRLQTRNPEEIIPHAINAEALIVQWASINRQVIESLQKCKVISRYGIGVDMVDLAAASERGIIVANVADYCIEEVSTQTIGFLLDLNRHTFLQNNHVHNGQWGVAPVPAKPPRRLSTQTLGIVGLGNIGRAVAQKAKAFGLTLLGYDPYINPDLLAGLDLELVSLDDLLRRSDFVSIHAPLVEETRKLISTPQLASMKPEAYLINMARGPIVDQVALHDALVNGTIAGAALDVLEQEPPAADEPILKLDNVIITPHTSSWSKEAAVQLRRSVAQNVIDVLQDRRPPSIVNRRSLGI